MFSLVREFNNIKEIVEQVSSMNFDSRLNLNKPTGKFFNDPWELLPEFKNTPLSKVIDNLSLVGEARLLKLKSAETYTAHADPDDRYHLAIKTNPYAFLVDIDNLEMYHLPADGKVWLMDTGRIHVASNFGGRDRIHLNIRVLLPKFDPNKKGMKIKFYGGDFDWKQESYIEIMPFFNKKIKSKEITGFEKLSQTEVLVNTENYDLFLPIIEKLKTKNFLITTELF